MSEDQPPFSSDIILYTSPSGQTRVEVWYQDETFWLTQKRMAELFGVEVNTINYHLKEIFSSGELAEDSVIRKIRITAEDGKNYLTNVYHLDAIIAVGYRVNSLQATQFRIWATGTLREFILKGFVLDDERLKQGSRFGKDYFDELLARILGLMTWKNAPDGKILATDITVAKNYLVEKEIKELERIVSMYLEYAENQAARQIPMKMDDWVKKLDGFLQFNEYEVLTNAGQVSAEVARQLAEAQFARFRVDQDRRFESDFEKEAKRLASRKVKREGGGV
jgi:hypothetical protein